MEEITSINTINKNYESKFKEKGSLFIGIALPISTPEEADEYLIKIKKEYYDATHHCYAYKVYPNITKYSDDGEPTGTAGIRLLNAINHYGLTNILLISIRYFGGTKLGVGPLGKAYYKNGIDTLENSSIITKELYYNYTVEYEYNLTKTIHFLLNKYYCKIQNTTYSQITQITEFKIKPTLISSISEELNSLTNNKAKLNFLNSKEFILN
ncbi:MAG TPA: YigZ family protein [Melioribacteraceae bacterium]|nr:YigZ family protein [Melioribacteraceae bacterium]